MYPSRVYDTRNTIALIDQLARSLFNTDNGESALEQRLTFDQSFAHARATIKHRAFNRAHIRHLIRLCKTVLLFRRSKGVITLSEDVLVLLLPDFRTETVDGYVEFLQEIFAFVENATVKEHMCMFMDEEFRKLPPNNTARICNVVASTETLKQFVTPYKNLPVGPMRTSDTLVGVLAFGMDGQLSGRIRDGLGDAYSCVVFCRLLPLQSAGVDISVRYKVLCLDINGRPLNYKKIDVSQKIILDICSAFSATVFEGVNVFVESHKLANRSGRSKRSLENSHKWKNIYSSAIAKCVNPTYMQTVPDCLLMDVRELVNGINVPLSDDENRRWTDIVREPTVVKIASLESIATLSRVAEGTKNVCANCPGFMGGLFTMGEDLSGTWTDSVLGLSSILNDEKDIIFTTQGILENGYDRQFLQTLQSQFSETTTRVLFVCNNGGRHGSHWYCVVTDVVRVPSNTGLDTIKATAITEYNSLTTSRFTDKQLQKYLSQLGIDVRGVKKIIQENVAQQVDCKTCGVYAAMSTLCIAAGIKIPTAVASDFTVRVRLGLLMQKWSALYFGAGEKYMLSDIRRNAHRKVGNGKHNNSFVDKESVKKIKRISDDSDLSDND